jgi:hypothetical protein
MHRSCMLLAAALAIAHVTPAAAQERRLDLAQPEHRLLERLAGEWHFERQSVPADGSSPRTLGTGVIRAEMVGDFFVVSRWSGTLCGAPYEALQSLGYDIEQEQYSGHWIDSFMSFRWDLEGHVDQDSQELVLTTSGPAPQSGTTMYRERYQFDAADSITILGEMQQREEWVPLSATRLTRQR